MNDSPEMLSADRQRLLKEHLMNEITRDAAAKASKPRSKPRSMPRRQIGWLAAPPLVVALAVAVALVGPAHHPHNGLVPTDPLVSSDPTHSASPTPVPSPRPSASASASASPSGAAAGVASPALSICPKASLPPVDTTAPTAPGDPVQALAAAARSVAGAQAPQVKDSQFVYTETLQRFDGQQACVRKDWVPLDGVSQGLIIDPQNGTMGLTPAQGVAASLAAPNYRYLASLPTDPAQLLQRVYAESAKASGRDGAAFRTIENVLITQLLPPAVEGAFCQTAAAVPGATVEPDAVDLLGRHGIGVVRADGMDRMELIFDRTTCAFLGHRDVRITDTSQQGGPPAGSVFESAVMLRAVTDHAGELPQG
ncbi:CU044_5270 family protein [Kitasatospora mediocidica]|uniref:CU044_5270 family protein n=1 Tax=Kitasatospora mediocidica TaxID=58352 RepID=UPI00068A97F0|nr:CU044_5270 family protein [Kitasatospora mediocidica]